MPERELHLEGAELSKEQVLEGLRKMTPHNDAERGLIESAAQYVATVLKSGRVGMDGDIYFGSAESQAGRCPVCSSAALDYRGQGVKRWTCDGCGCSGIEYERIVFAGHRVDRLTALGKQIIFGGSWRL